MKILKYILCSSILILFLLIAVNASAANYYVNCENSGSANEGSFAQPWNVLSSISISSGDGVYFAGGTTCTLNGSTIDNIIISDASTTWGCYDGDGDFTCETANIFTGANMPKFDGGNTYPVGDYESFIAITAANVTVQDLWITGMHAGGIEIDSNGDDGDYAIIQRNRVEDCRRQGIFGNQSTGSTFTKNFVTGVLNINDDNCTDIGGAAITCDSGCLDTTISYNFSIANYGEGIGSYYNRVTAGHPGIIEYNTVYNNRSAGIHSSDSETIIRYNIVGTYDIGGDGYEPTLYGGSYPSCGTLRSSNSGGIAVITVPSGSAYDNVYHIYGNIVFGHVGCGGIDASMSEASETEGDTLTFYIYNNTIIDSNPGIRTNESGGDDGTQSYVRNNIIAYYNYTGTLGSEVDGNGNITYDHNAWGNSATDIPGTGDVVGDPLLATQTGFVWPAAWNTFDGTEFALLLGSPAIDTGVDLVSYDNMINPNTVDFTLVPPNIDLLDGSAYGAAHDIGALVFTLYISSVTPADEVTGIVNNIAPTWTNPTGYTSVDVLLAYDSDDDGSCADETPTVVTGYDDVDVTTLDNADMLTHLSMTGDLDDATKYCWRVDINHAGGTQTGLSYEFTTTSTPGSPANLTSIIVGE